MIRILLTLITAILISGCATGLSMATGFASGGVTLYKSTKESGPKIEVVLFKFQHDTYTTVPLASK
jgi:uncharacterized protein YceK